MFEHQLRYNQPYARYCARFGIAPDSLPASWEGIVAVPAGAFKEAAMATFDARRAALAFETSGTSGGASGRHYLETSTLYDASLLAGFDRFVLADGARLRYLNLVPDPRERPQSSLGYMMARIAALRGDGATGWYVRGDELAVDAFEAGVRAAIAEGQPVCVAATAFGLVRLLEAMAERSLRFTLAPGSRIMETGGFKGKTRVVDRDDLYAQTRERFGLASDAIVSEYGMTELASQYYDDPPGSGKKKGPPWLRARVVGPDGKTLPPGTPGAIVHLDLANRSSCVAIATADVGIQTADGLELIGREADAPARGCSLDAEDLQPR